MKKTFLSETTRAKALIFGMKKMFVCGGGRGEGVGSCYALLDYSREEASLIVLYKIVYMITFHLTSLVQIVQVSDSGPLWPSCKCISSLTLKPSNLKLCSCIGHMM